MIMETCWSISKVPCSTSTQQLLPRWRKFTRYLSIIYYEVNTIVLIIHAVCQFWPINYLVKQQNHDGGLFVYVAHNVTIPLWTVCSPAILECFTNPITSLIIGPSLRQQLCVCLTDSLGTKLSCTPSCSAVHSRLEQQKLWLSLVEWLVYMRCFITNVKLPF